MLSSFKLLLLFSLLSASVKCNEENIDSSSASTESEGIIKCFQNLSSVIDSDVECNLTESICGQLLVLPNAASSYESSRYFGCVDYLEIGAKMNGRIEENKQRTECMNIGNSFAPRQSVVFKGDNETRVGQFLCCGQFMCNEEPFIPLEGIFHAKPIGRDSKYGWAMFSGYRWAIIAVGLILIYPLISHMLHLLDNIRLKDREMAEIGCEIAQMDDYDQDLAHYNDDVDGFNVESGKIPTIQKVQKIYDRIRQNKTCSREPYKGKSKHKVSIVVRKGVNKVSPMLISNTNPSVGARFDTILFELLMFGPHVLRVKPHNVASLFADLYEVVSKQPSLIELPPDEYLILGDLRGEYMDLHCWLQINGYPPKKKLIVLGSCVDNENCFSLETFVFLAALKVAMPYDVYLLRGATETLSIALAGRASRCISNAITTVASNIFAKLPAAVIIGGRILCVHSGISPLIDNHGSLRSIDRNRGRQDPEKIFAHILFSEPCTEIPEYHKIADSRGLYYGADAVKDVCHKLDLDVIIRSHNPTEDGFFVGANKKLLSLWSTPGYGMFQKGAAAVVHAGMIIEIVQMRC